MVRRSVAEALTRARTRPEYWIEKSILEFTEELVRKMEEVHISRADLARKLGVEPAYITRCLRGNANFTLGSMVRLAMAVDMELRIHLAPAGSGTTWFDDVRTYRVPGASRGAIAISKPGRFSRGANGTVTPSDGGLDSVCDSAVA